jgi:DNA-3-methyladenine glycosylase
MSQIQQLTREFYARNTMHVAHDLLGMSLVRVEGELRLKGIIIEVEAYRGEEDLGCHARAGQTKRTEIMYGSPGHAYVYFTYGMHWMLNFVTEREGFPAAVLIRAIQIEEGKTIVASRRSKQPANRWTDGPAKLCKALNIDGRLNGYDLCQTYAELFVESNYGKPICQFEVKSTPRIGLNGVPEPWKSVPWRFCTVNQGEIKKDGRTLDLD